MLDIPADKRDDFAKLIEHYGDRDWRLDHLYYVQDEKGSKVLYKRRTAQKAYCENSWLLDVIAKARQLGFSTEIGIEITDLCVFRKDTACGIIDFKLEDAKKKLAKIRYAYEYLPPYIQQKVRLTKDNEDELRFSNGSSVVVGTTHRGGTLQFLHISEFGKTAVEKPELAREIIAGALNTVAPGQQIKVESTCHGTKGKFYDIVEKAKAKAIEGTPLTVLDFKLHFYGWMYRDDYRIPVGSVILTQDVIDYFHDLKKRHGVIVDGDQMAWYQMKLASLGWDDMRSEFPSVLDECFFNSLEGAIFKKEMSKARHEHRIGHRVPHDPTRRVYTAWDKGINEKSDRNSIWWFQHDGVRFRWIDYYENAGETLAHYVNVIEEKRVARKFIYANHYGPHDLKQRVWASTGLTPKTMEDVALELGLRFTIVPKVDDKQVSIEAARRVLNNSWFCQEYCSRGVEGLDSYRKTWNKILSEWTPVPFHDWASNPADAFQCGSMGAVPEKTERPRGDRGDRQRGSQWSR